MDINAIARLFEKLNNMSGTVSEGMDFYTEKDGSVVQQEWTAKAPNG